MTFDGLKAKAEVLRYIHDEIGIPAAGEYAALLVTDILALISAS